MSIVTLFSASHCHGDEIARRVAETVGYPLLSNEQLLRETASRFEVDEDRLSRSMHGPRSVFNKFTREKERHVAYIRLTLAELLQPDNFVYHGFAAHLLPKSLQHVLRVCLVARPEHRVKAAQAEGLDTKAARKLIEKEDEGRKAWTLYLFGLSPWKEELYDILIPVDSTSIEQATDLIVDRATHAPVKSTGRSKRAMDDFLLTARVQLTLVEKGHDVDIDVASRDGLVTLTLNRYVVRVEHLQDKLREIVGSVAGVRKVEFKFGPHFSPPALNPYARIDREVPPKVLLVDDEQEFVLTLSERLQSRNLESAIAFDGEQALQIIETDAPDVMILDINMPGINGLEVLRRVKQAKPFTEVIILTGHGSEKEETRAAELGAFAYLTKPVNIDVLAETMKKAYARIQAAARSESDDESA
jgi:CheY-like chemotaxis protein/cytidylate kinase